jgi:hypothetical protein
MSSKTCTSLWRTDSVQCQAGTPGEQVALGKTEGCRGYNSPDCPVFTRLSGMPVTRLANGRPCDQQAPRVPDQRSPGCIGISGAPPDYLVCHGTRGW